MTVAAANDIFVGHRALGLVCNSVPFAIKFEKKRGEYLIFTAVGRHFHSYGGTRINLLSVSPVHNEELTALACDSRRVYSAAGGNIYAWRRGIELKQAFTGAHQKSRVKFLLPFGDQLISADDAGTVVVWAKEDASVYTTLDLSSLGGLSAVVHPNTYVNKILFASAKGTMQLWNIASNKLVFEFKHFAGEQILCVEQSPAVDVMGVGLASGRVALFNLKLDELLMDFTQDWGPVTAISFRTNGPCHMATSSAGGQLSVWDLDEQKLHSQLPEAHGGRVTRLHFLANEPLLLSAGADNALKMWIFDMADGGGRQLKIREGHAHPPRRVRFYDATGKQILSGGGDATLKSFSTVHDAYNRNFGSATYSRKALKRAKSYEQKQVLKFPPVCDIASEVVREKQWDSVVTVHERMRLVQTWSADKGSLGQHKLLHERFLKDRRYHSAVATCAALTPCGNFALVGYSSGHVDRFNIQSGQHRAEYGTDGLAHEGQVRVVASDALNQFAISGGADAALRFWKFNKFTAKPVATVSLDAPCSMGILHRESGMLALALDDFSAAVVDLSVRRVVRRFSAVRSPLSDLAFSPDGRWLIGSSFDSVVRTWDLPTGSLISAFRTPAPVTSLCFSPTGNFLATALADHVGIYLWANTTLYDAVKMRPLPHDFVPSADHAARLPAARIDKPLDDEDEEDEDDKPADDDRMAEDDGDEVETGLREPKENATLTQLSDQPVSRWANLLSMDVIRQRNKPKEAPAKPQSAPFFLPTVQGLEFKFDVDKDTEDSSLSKVVTTSAATSYSAFANVLLRCAETENYAPAVDKLKLLGPSAIEMEIRALAPDQGGSLELMAAFVDAMGAALRTRRDFELANAYLALFMKLHGNACLDEDEVCDRLERVGLVQKSTWRSVSDLFSQSLCIINYLRSAVL